METDSEWKIHSLLPPILIFHIQNLHRIKALLISNVKGGRNVLRHNPIPTIPLSHMSFRSQRQFSRSLPWGAVCLLRGAVGVAGRLFQEAAGKDEGRRNGSPCKSQPTNSGRSFTRQPCLCQGYLLKVDQTTFGIFSHSHGMGWRKIVVTESECLSQALGPSTPYQGSWGSYSTPLSPTPLSYKMATIIALSPQGYSGY